MKVVRDLSVTSLSSNPVAVPWDAAWASPLSATDAALIVDFAAGVYGKDGTQSALASTLSLTRNSPASYVSSNGSLATALAHEPRLTHDPVNFAREGLVVEASRSNLLAFSAAPSGQTVTVTNVPHVLSFYGPGTVTLSGAHADTLDGNGAYPTRTSLVFTPAAGDLTLSFAGTVENAQLEAATIPSTYIDTGVAPATRDEDIATIGLGTWFSATGGTLVFSGSVTDAAANDRIIEMDGGDSTTRLTILWNTVLGKPQFQVWDGGSLQAAVAPSGSAVALDEHFRVAVAYSADDFAISLNGSAVATDTLGTLPTGIDTLRLGRSIWGAQGLIEVESVVYYPLRLSNAEVQALSS